MNDDELGRFLRSEVPEPGAGYWEEIDRRLQQAEAQVEVERDVEAEGHVEVERDVEVGQFPDIGDTDDNVIRLTDMNQATLPQKQTRAPLILAAAAVLLAVAGFAVFRSSTVFQSTDTVGPADQTSTDGTATADSEADANRSDGSGTSDDTPGVADGSDSPVEDDRVCYAGTIAPNDEVPGSDAYAWVERDGSSATVGIFLEIDDLQDIEVGEGTIDADGVFTGTTRSSSGFENRVDTLVVTDEAISDTVEAIRIPAVPCNEVATQMQAIDDAAAQIDAGTAADGTAESVAFGEEPAKVWTVTGDEPVNVHAAPGEASPVLTTVPAGDRLGGAGGAATVAPDGARWVSIWLRLPNLPASFGWVQEDRISPVAWAGWQCYSSNDPQSVLALDPLAPADTPLGAFVIIPSEDPLGNEPEVHILASAPASNPDEIGDELPVYVQIDDGWEAQSWAQTSFGIAGQELAWETVPCDEVGEGLAYIEAFRTDIDLPEPTE